MKWIIYKHTNKVNNKVYIGQTCQKPEYRWGQYGQKYSKDNLKFYNAIKRYGWNNFFHEIIESNIKSIEEANQREIFWIDYYDSFYNGYNMTKGGRDGEYLGEPIYQIDIKTLKVLSKFKSTQDAVRYLGKEHGSSISACCLGYQISAFGYFWCKETDYYEGWTPRSNKAIRPIFQIDKNTLKVVMDYKSISEASKKYGGTKAIAACCRRNQSEAMGFYWCYVDEYDDSWKPKKNFHFKSVLQINKNFEIVANYATIKEASQKNKICATTILMCCKRKYITAGDYYWCYVDEYDLNWKPVEKKESHTCGKVVCKIDKKTLQCLEKFNSVSYAAQRLGLSKDSIARCCRREMIQTGGYYWCYENDIKTFIPLSKKNHKEIYTLDVRKKMSDKKKKKPVKFIDNNGYMHLYNSVMEASRVSGVDASSIIRCCKGIVKSAGGYIWEYVDKEKD